MRTLLALLLALVAAASNAFCQDPPPPQTRGLAGTYQVKDANGNPIEPHGIDRIHFVPIFGTPLFLGVWTVDLGDGPIFDDDPDATCLAWPTTNGYAWESVSGAFGGTLSPTRYGFRQDFTNPPAQSNQFHRE